VSLSPARGPLSGGLHRTPHKAGHLPSKQTGACGCRSSLPFRGTAARLFTLFHKVSRKCAEAPDAIIKRPDGGALQAAEGSYTKQHRPRRVVWPNCRAVRAASWHRPGKASLSCELTGSCSSSPHCPQNRRLRAGSGSYRSCYLHAKLRHRNDRSGVCKRLARNLPPGLSV